MLTPGVTVVQHRTRFFGLVVKHYRTGCHSVATEKYWGWKTKRSRLIVCRADGTRLTARRYNQLLLTTDGRLLGLRFHGARQLTAEYVAETGQRKVMADFVTVNQLKVAREVDSHGHLTEHQGTRAAAQ
ncbi:hypothetical protein EJV47_22215 [Hymenobacter gummosus]|uniref:Uncharacterized protein n=1 Tax=Hymenobacter gummosus TaxID=1776032 RepID=A0A3S0H1X7_9BACT|nr:hypothetical protein EJV47_22215 [Hymenobacter gummosus]